ncbi:5-formyltetrahydrofolate cyclo-ligase [Staphylococcus auricularis]|uniref:5-formyltetrahydrofolate cyclo-ligase n=1 Tax=Staphylococcus auricularis TaxID=29379 RepID=UPI003EB80A20
MDKKTLRKNTIAKMKSFNDNDKQKADQYLANKLYETNQYQQAKRIGIVLSMSQEVDTYRIISHMLDDYKTVFVPETDYDKKEMNFKQVEDIAQIGKDAKGINHSTADLPISNDLDLVIVPGVAFNQEGYRIGYGGGFYDKFLAQYQTDTISLLYDFQLADFDVEPHDQPVDQLIIATT